MITERAPFIDKIHNLKIPKSDLAALAGVDPTRVSEYIRNRHVPAGKVAAIEQAVNDVARVWSLLSPFRIDLSDTELFKRAVLEIDSALAGLAVAKAEIVQKADAIPRPAPHLQNRGAGSDPNLNRGE
jgi:hypothetical protein